MYCGCQLGIMFFFNEKLYKKFFLFFFTTDWWIFIYAGYTHVLFNASVANSNTKDCITCTYMHIVCVCWTEIMRDQNVNELWCKIFVWCHFQLCMSKISSFKELCKTSQFIYEIFVFLQTLVKLKIRDIDTYIY